MGLGEITGSRSSYKQPLNSEKYPTYGTVNLINDCATTIVKKDSTIKAVKTIDFTQKSQAAPEQKNKNLDAFKSTTDKVTVRNKSSETEKKTEESAFPFDFMKRDFKQIKFKKK